jgi:hypothetical protein
VQRDREALTHGDRWANASNCGACEPRQRTARHALRLAKFAGIVTPRGSFSITAPKGARKGFPDITSSAPPDR